MFKVHGLGPNWRTTQKHIRYQKTDDADYDEEDTSDASPDDESSNEDESNMYEMPDTKKQEDDFLCNKLYITYLLSN